jgi:hypothetical protein
MARTTEVCPNQPATAGTHERVHAIMAKLINGILPPGSWLAY